MIKGKELREYAKKRDKAFIKAVENDNFEPAKKLFKEYCVKVPENEEIMKAGIYKAVQECTNIPAHIKKTAKKKCEEIGFYPYMR